MVRVLVAANSGNMHPAMVLIMQHRIEVFGLIGIAVAASIVVDGEGHMSLRVCSDKGEVIGHRDEVRGRDQRTCILSTHGSSSFPAFVMSENPSTTSKRGKQSQSMDPARLTRAAERQSDS